MAEVRVPGIACILILNGHAGAWGARLGFAIVAIGSDAAAGHHPVLRLEASGHDRCITVIVILRGIVEDKSIQ